MGILDKVTAAVHKWENAHLTEIETKHQQIRTNWTEPRQPVPQPTKPKPKPKPRRTSLTLARGVLAPCPFCHSRKHAIRGGEGIMSMMYVIAVRCRKCGIKGHVAISKKTAKQIYDVIGDQIHWSEEEIVARKRS